MAILKKIQKFKEFLGAQVWQLFCFAVALGLLWFVVESSFVFVLQGFLVAIDFVEVERTFLPDWYPLSPLSAAFLLIAFGAARGLVWMLKYYSAGVTGQAFIRYHRIKLLSHALLRYGRIPSHEIMAVFTDHVTSAGSALHHLSNLIINSISVLLFILFAFQLAPVELGLGLTIMVLIVFPTKYFDHRQSTLSQSLAELRTRVSRVILEGMRNNFYLKVTNSALEEVRKGSADLDLYEEHYKKFYVYSALRSAFPMIGGSFVVAVVTFFSLKWLGTSGAVLISFFYLFIRIAQGASEAVTNLSEFRVHLAGLRMLYQMSNRLEGLSDVISRPAGAARLPTGALKIVAQRVGFRYTDSVQPVFRDLSFSTEPGELLLIRGESGSGKSTLLSLILGLTPPTSGQVTINEISTTELDPSWLEKVAYVGPEPFLIAGTVRENLLYGLASARQLSDEDLWIALKSASLDDVIQRLDHGLDETLYEAAQLSTGQKQRLALARALLRNPSLLILDEATANLDPETEKEVISMLKDLKQKIPLIVVSHKDVFDSDATSRIDL